MKFSFRLFLFSGLALVVICGLSVIVAKDILLGNWHSQNFYGKVVDQYGNPVPDVTAVGTLLWVRGIDVGEQRERHTVTTDQNGEFKFTGFHAWQLAVTVGKNGYEIGRSPGVYRAPNKERKTSEAERAVFTMWRLKGAETLIHAKIEAGLACDGTSRRFDIVTGSKDGGELVATLVRDPINIDRSKPFNWEFSLRVEGTGGLIEIEDTYPYLAPEGGYHSIRVAMPAEVKGWSDSLVKSYYYFDGRNYARVTIDLMANYQPPPTHFEIDAYYNPSGSRNLEFDRQKQIKVGRQW